MRLTILLVIALFVSAGCARSTITDDEVQGVAKTLDYGDYQSTTLATKSWDALAAEDYVAVMAYTSKCIELYGEEGKSMNAELTMFAPVERVNRYWALNDAGTCMYIQATTYEKLRMYPEAAQAFRSLADDFTYSQCWDPKGWYWHPASGASAKADKYASK